MAKTYKLFFSWQSDDNESRKLLEKALDSARMSLGLQGVKLEIDHSTLGVSGMPSIDQTILRKIDACDIFLADVTPLCNYENTLGNGLTVNKEVPNPNVLLELGYAMSALGVDYVVVVAHQGQWKPADMPFDINHRSIYSFTSKACNLTPKITAVIDFINKNGRHRHLDKPYLINWLEKKVERFFPRGNDNEMTIIAEESTSFFRRRMAEAFPGSRGLLEITKPRDIYRHLSKLLSAPLKFDMSIDCVGDPIWWFRAGSALDVTSFKRVGRRRFMIGWDELVIRRIVAFVENGRYYSNYVYVEAKGQKPTGLDKHLTSERINELKVDMDGLVDEEYAIYKPCWLFRKKITKQEEDDGSTKLFGSLVKMKRSEIETRCRHLTDYNFIIAAKGSAFNNNTFDRTSGDYFKGLLDGSVTIDQFHDYLMTFPKPDMRF